MHSLQGVLTSFKITRKWQKISRGGNHGGTCIGRLFNLTTAQQEATSASRDAEIAAPHSAATEALQNGHLDGPGHANNNLP